MIISADVTKVFFNPFNNTMKTKFLPLITTALLLLAFSACSNLPSFSSDSDKESDEIILYDTVALAHEVLDLENEYRLSQGLNELSWDDELVYVASIRAVEIEQKWDHVRPDGTKYVAILDDIGYKSTLVGENLGRYQTSAESVMEQWEASYSHNANLLGNYNKLGVYVYQSDKGKLYWVQIFAK